ncbi:hypothetical protein FS837_010384 [Tulasnella sp. UAMH 9824]|nr:hypothetical protein FS837_010384 [Tulasnella sp. UAMH 9824]
MLDFRSYKVSIRVDDRDLPVYQPEYDEDTKTATCWIASEEGRSYSIFCEQPNYLSYSTSARVDLDGGQNGAKRLLGKGFGRSASIRGVRVSPTELCPFQFASLKTTDDDAYLDRPTELKAPGTIRVQMYRVQVTGSDSWKPPPLPQVPSFVHERSKKAGAHITQFGKKEVSGSSQIFFAKPYTSADTDPWVTFEFRYRSAAILQAEGIMPKPQSSQTKNLGRGREKGEKGGEHEAEILALEAEQAKLDGRGAALKAKLGSVKVKRQASPIRVPRSAVPEVIDLTLEYV